MGWTAFLPLIQQGISSGMQNMDAGMEHISGLGNRPPDDLYQLLARQRVGFQGPAAGPSVGTSGQAYGAQAGQNYAAQIARRRRQQQGGKVGAELSWPLLGALGIPLPPPSALSALTGTAKNISGQGQRGAQGALGVF